MVKITKKGQKAWVTFSIIPENVDDVSVCGEWNDWQDEPMKVKKSGEFYITKVLPIDNEYQFGYRIKDQWHNDAELDSVPTPFGSLNALLKI